MNLTLMVRDMDNEGEDKHYEDTGVRYRGQETST